MYLFMVYDFSDGLESIWFSDKPAGIVTNRIRLDSRLKIGNNAALNISNEAYLLEEGKIALHDEAKKLLKDDYIRKAYLGI